MDKLQAQELIQRYVENRATAAERQVVERYFLTYLKERSALPDEEIIAAANREMRKNLHKHIALTAKPAPRMRRLWPAVAAAASVLLVMAALFFGLPYWKASQERVQIVGKLRVSPGKNTATLRIDNGEVVQLSETMHGVIIDAASVTYNDGSRVVNAAPLGRMLTAETPRGGMYEFTLSDGTRVWLNAASSLRFPSVFEKGERRVELSGEAYFEVSKLADPTPFLVVSAGQLVEVLGTHFNIEGYGKGGTKTTLLEGSVRVSPLSVEGRVSGSSVLLQPDHQSRLNNDELQVVRINAEEAIAWKNGYFDFNEEPLESIMERIARWYDVKVVYENPALRKQRFTGNISRANEVSDVLNKLALTRVLRFKIDGRRVIVTD
ncbi:FecR family protein [Pedobacter faecalis]|uniref:FecR family protein n=1 Tax=Pedobacter faecalis TaxID=3041495 RepID=UPI00254E86BE|nr:FecR domain-containing protein [Pedobacter sp. ELA7]